MKNFINRAKSKFTNATSRCKKEFAALTAITATAMPMSTYALQASGLMQSILNIIYDIFKYIGVLLLAWSVGMLVLAFKNEDADSKSRAMMMMVVSIALIGIGAVIGPIVGQYL